ncbi:MAG: UDP-N-acetylmuramate:L-alanyl-gamma-D-glutamyl-meso-diaminopimelate ligase [Rhodanobacteraceae bacterium]
MRLHILGICGTFMGGLAALARELGHEVSGSDANVYPPMSDQLERLGIRLYSGYRAEYLDPAPDLVIIGNALSRGNAAVEHVLDARLPYISGPQWLGDTLLAGRTVLAVAGTHGKTTTTSMLAFVLDAQGLDPGFLIGGVPANFDVSARMGGKQKGGQSHFPTIPPSGVQHGQSDADPLFVVEADEYDTAFFDKRSKFVHYHASIAILANLEYDHADIFPDLASIQRQFHALVRTVPRNGRLIVNAEDSNIAALLAIGCWSPIDSFGIDAGDWRARLIETDGSAFAVSHSGREIGDVHWQLLGRHNVMNALAALAAAHAMGADVARALPALAHFRGVARRLELIGDVAGIKVYDDFAHHPSAIATTLAGLRARVGDARILVGLEPRSASMRLGAHADQLGPSLANADAVVLLQRPDLSWDATQVVAAAGAGARIASSVDLLVTDLCTQARAGDYVVFMSNGSFGDAPRRLVAMLDARS